MDKRAPTPEVRDGNPRRVLLRASLRQATEQDAELRALARTLRAEDGLQASGCYELPQA